MQFKCDGNDRGWKYRNDCIYLGSLLTLDTRTLVSMFVSEYVWPKTSGVTWPDSSGHVRRLPSTFYFRARQFQVLWAPSTLFLLLCESAHVWPIKMYLRWSLFFITRSPLSGASIFHSYPLSQPCLFFFLFHGVVRTSAWFRGKLKSPPRILVLKIKRYGTGLTQGYNQYGCSG